MHKDNVFYLNIFPFHNFITTRILIEFGNYFVDCFLQCVLINYIINYFVGITRYAFTSTVC
jgi:hypothetical protein